eukprot:gb/GFBE01014795.1/.p1 GENE.gb/GFBE01014795.1/~~gb/GFBE01014795.1/.p1  ORF type:complete len:488 (+),score=105.28 gb/GFBE01014795.1/:1-1464(+)
MTRAANFAPPVSRPASAGHRRRGASAHTLNKLRNLREKAANQLETCKLARTGYVAPSAIPEVVEQRLGGVAAVEHIKQRAATVKDTGESLQACLERTEKTLFAVRKTVEDLVQARATLKSQQLLAESRAGLRAQRPRVEKGTDLFQQALEAERKCLDESYALLAGHIEGCREWIARLEKARTELVASRLTLHLDRTGQTARLVARASSLEEQALEFCAEAEVSQLQVEEQAEKARVRTSSAMKSCISKLQDLRRQMEQEIKLTLSTLADAHKQLDKTQKELARLLSAPEKKLGASTKQTRERYRAINRRYGETLSKVRAKMKGAAYTGTAGRQLDVLFTRFDTDQSGELDEDEVRQAFRRTIKVPPSVLTDAEIHGLFRMLDHDKSGAIDILELVAFLESDVTIEKLEAKCTSLQDTIEQLSRAKQQALEDLRLKTVAWQIDVSCSKMNAKRLEVEGKPPPSPCQRNAADGPPASTASKTIPGKRKE